MTTWLKANGLLVRPRGSGKRTPEEFWAMVEKSDDPDGCWPWKGGRYASGYGYIRFRYKLWRAHRLSYTLTYRPIPDGLFVLHKCDHKWCVRPEHLYAGTIADNARDAMERGGMYVGEGNGNAKLTEEAVVVIRRVSADGSGNGRELAEVFGVSTRMINLIARRESWTHVPEALPGAAKASALEVSVRERLRAMGGVRRFQKEADVRSIRQLYADGNVTKQHLAGVFGVSNTVIDQIVRRKSWKHVSDYPPPAAQAAQVHV